MIATFVGGNIASERVLVRGKSYPILGVHGRDDGIRFRIINNIGDAPGLHLANLFNIIDKNVPSEWVFNPLSQSEWELGPKAWAYESFWSDYFNDEEVAVRTFNDVVGGLY